MRTWGQVRLLLRQRFPALSLDLLTSHIQTAYELILDRQPWSQLEVTGRLSLIGRVDVVASVTRGSVSVSGTGLLADHVGRWFRVGNSEVYYRIGEFNTADGTLILDRPYEGETATDQDSVIFAHRYALPIDCKALSACGVLGPDGRRNSYELDARPLDWGDPVWWAPLPEAEEGLKRVQLHPAPLLDGSIPISYKRALPGFDGTNTQDVPASWVSDAAIIAKASALCCIEPGVGLDPTAWLIEYNTAVNEMTTQDAARAPQKMRLARRLTRHDRMRAAR